MTASRDRLLRLDPRVGCLPHKSTARRGRRAPPRTVVDVSAAIGWVIGRDRAGKASPGRDTILPLAAVGRLIRRWAGGRTGGLPPSGGGDAWRARLLGTMITRRFLSKLA